MHRGNCRRGPDRAQFLHGEGFSPFFQHRLLEVFLLTILLVLQLHLGLDCRHFFSCQVLYGLGWRTCFNCVVGRVQFLEGVVFLYLFIRRVHEYFLLSFSAWRVNGKTSTLEVGFLLELD